jgi:cytidylate kinase
VSGLTFITISRESGSFGEEIALKLAESLNIPLISRSVVMSDWFPEIADKHELHMLSESPRFYLTNSKLDITFAAYLEQRLRDVVARQSVIIFGLGSQIIFANHPEAIHVKIMASTETRLNRLRRIHRLGHEDARRMLQLTDRKHKRYVSTIYNQDWSDLSHYHLVLNTDLLSIDESVSLLRFAFENKHTLTEAAESEEDKTAKAVVFKNDSEQEFAKILDMYGLEWEYEPHTFPIEWDSEGNITLAFSPDFYLPRFKTYIELTTMNQKYVSEKKKKMKKLKELYPGINITMVFKSDFHALMKRFGLQKGTDV